MLKWSPNFGIKMAIHSPESLGAGYKLYSILTIPETFCFQETKKHILMMIKTL